MKAIILPFIIWLVLCLESLAVINDPVLYWKFDENTGTNATDSSGNSRNGTLTGSPTWVTGKIGTSALSFSGTNYVSRASFQLSTNGSIGFWFKPVRANNSGVDEFLFETISGGDLCHFRKYVDNLFYTGFYGSGEYRVSAGASTVTWPQNVWVHYCLTWVGGGGVTTLYVNGTSIGTKTPTTSTIGSASFILGTNFTGAQGTTGAIDDFRIYARTLSSTDVTELSSFTGSVLPQIAVHYTRMQNQ